MFARCRYISGQESSKLRNRRGTLSLVRFARNRRRESRRKLKSHAIFGIAARRYRDRCRAIVFAFDRCPINPLHTPGSFIVLGVFRALQRFTRSLVVRCFVRPVGENDLTDDLGHVFHRVSRTLPTARNDRNLKFQSPEHLLLDTRVRSTRKRIEENYSVLGRCTNPRRVASRNTSPRDFEDRGSR